IATFVSWNNHPDTMSSANRLISSDYPHYLRQFVEHELGGTAVYFVGTLGCQIGALFGIPVPLWDENYQKIYSSNLDPHGNLVPELVTDGFDKIRSIGYEIGNEAVQALKQQSWLTEEPRAWIRTEPLDIAVDNPIHVAFTGSVWHDDVSRRDRMVTYPGR